MHIPLPLLAPAEDADMDDWICTETLPWDETWEETYASFASTEPLAVLERMPTENELLAIEAQADEAVEYPENEIEAADDC